MKILNFTAVEILPKLLSKEKTQTIRPAWKETKCASQTPLLQPDSTYRHRPTAIEKKPPRFKVGEKVKLMWKQRSKYLCFCRNTGIGVPPVMRDAILKEDIKSTAIFNKTIGTAKITDVFKVKLRMDEISEGKNKCIIFPNNYDFGQITEIPDVLDDIAKRDGFKNSKEMFKYFDKNYDLSTLKEFWVYRWEWD